MPGSATTNNELPSPSEPHRQCGAQRRVVYIEDNPANVALLEDVMADMDGVELLTAADAETGLALVRAQQPDAVIMDIHLPGMTGIEAARVLRQWPETRSIPLIGLSAAANIRESAGIASAGFFRFLTKPLDIDLLVDTVEQALASARPAGAASAR